MDVLADLLGGPRGRDPFLFRQVMRPPWAVRIQDRAPVGIIAVLNGTATVVPEPPGTGAVAPGHARDAGGTATTAASSEPRAGPGSRCSSPRTPSRS